MDKEEEVEKEQETTLAMLEESKKPLAEKHPIISYTFKIRGGSEGYWEFMRSNHEVQGFKEISQIFDKMDRDDIIAIWGLYKEKYDGKKMDTVLDINLAFENVLYRILKNMFDPQPGESEWNEIGCSKVHKWFLYQSCGVHELRTGAVTLFLLVEKDYPSLHKYPEVLRQMVRPGFLKCQQQHMSDNQAYNLIQKYEKILDPTI